MLTITNLIIVAFVLAMAYWWATQGLFSAFLHLCVVIAAGTLALAVWEPLAMGFLLHRMPSYAWTVGLLGPFVLLLLILRMLMDKYVRLNMQFHRMANAIGGGACGAASGILTAGIAMVGIGFLPLPADANGYVPYIMDSHGTIVANSSRSLWLPVDHWASGFYSSMSEGVFATATPMAVYQPDLAMQAALIRLRPDPNSSIVAAPETVTVDKVYIAPTTPKDLAVTIGGPLQEKQQLVVVETHWTNNLGMSLDGIARIAPTQVWLVTQAAGHGGQRVHHYLPAGVSQPVSKDKSVYLSLMNDHTVATSLVSPYAFNWSFRVPAGETPLFLLARHLHIPLPPAVHDDAAMVAAIGTPGKPAPETAATEPADQGGGTVGDQHGVQSGQIVKAIEISNKLPHPISHNDVANALSWGDVRGSGIESGNTTVHATTITTKWVTADHIVTPKPYGMVRVQVDRDQARSLLGKTFAFASKIGAPWLEDDLGRKIFAIAFVWARKNGEQVIHVDKGNPIQSAVQFHIDEMTSGDQLYLYFQVPHGVTITRYVVNSRASQDVHITVP